MTLKEFLENDNKFYHITHKSNIPAILATGLLNKNKKGICVIRSKHKSIIQYVCATMLCDTDEKEFSIIEISPKKHNLQINEIRQDHVPEKTCPLHNYILRNKLTIEKTDIVDEYIMDTLIPNMEEYEKELDNLGLIEKLQ
jgi:hypothetical protein